MIYRRSLGVLQVTLTCWIVVVVVNADLAMNTIWNVYLFEHHGCMIIRGNLTCAEKLAKNHLSTYEETENNFPGGSGVREISGAFRVGICSGENVRGLVNTQTNTQFSTGCTISSATWANKKLRYREEHSSYQNLDPFCCCCSHHIGLIIIIIIIVVIIVISTVINIKNLTASTWSG